MTVTWHSAAQPPPGYWLEVCRGRKAANLFVDAQTEESKLELMALFPVLLLPEFLETMRGMEDDRGMAAKDRDWLGCADSLEELQKRALDRDREEVQSSLLELAYLLAEETAGSSEMNLVVSARLLSDARMTLEPGSPDYLDCLLDESIVRHKLGKLGKPYLNELVEAATLYSEIRSLGCADEPLLCKSLLYEGEARRNLAERGGDEPVRQLAHSIQLYRKAATLLPQESGVMGQCLASQGGAYLQLARLGEDREANLTLAVEKHDKALPLLARDFPRLSSLYRNFGAVHLEMAEDGVDTRKNLERAAELFNLARLACPTGPTKQARDMVTEAGIHTRLASDDKNPESRLRKSRALLLRARLLFSQEPKQLALCLAHEGHTRLELAKRGAERKHNTDKALQLLEDAEPLLDRTTLFYRDFLALRAEVLEEMAAMGTSPPENLWQALRFARSARVCSKEGSEEFGRRQVFEARLMGKMAEQGVDTARNLGLAVELFKEARTHLPPTGEAYVDSLQNEAMARRLMCQDGIQVQCNLAECIRLARTLQALGPEAGSAMVAGCVEELKVARMQVDLGLAGPPRLMDALELLARTRASTSLDKRELAEALMEEGIAWMELARRWKRNPEEDLDKALELLREAAQCLGDEYPEMAAGCMINRGVAHKALADLGVDAVANIYRAVVLYGHARKAYPPGSPPWAGCYLNEGNALESLLERGQLNTDGYKQAMAAYAKAAECYPKGHPSLPHCLASRAQMAHHLSGIYKNDDHMKVAYLKQALRDYQQSEVLFPKESQGQVATWCNAGNVSEILARLAVDSRQNASMALDWYKKAGEFFARIGDEENHKHMTRKHGQLTRWVKSLEYGD